MYKIAHIIKLLLLISVVIGITLTACKKPERGTPYFPDVEDEPGIDRPTDKEPADTINEIGKKMVFQLGNYSGTIPNFEDSVKKTLAILSEVFSSMELKDSLSKYTFVCSNSGNYSCLANRPNIHRTKCDNGLQLIKGETVYEDLVADSIVNINIDIRPSTGSSPFGFTYVCSSTITSYDWFLKGGRVLPTTIEYAVHLAHEYMHTIGYVHSDLHKKSEDVAYTIGGIVRNILVRRANLAAIAGQELATVLGTGKFTYMRIRAADLPGLSPDFMQLYTQLEEALDITDQRLNYLYLHFLPDNKATLNVRIINSNNSYFIARFDMGLVIDDDGIAKFTYLGTTNANATNQQRIMPIIDYITSGPFSVSFMNQPAPSSSIVGGFMSVENPSSYFYGVMLEKI